MNRSRLGSRRPLTDGRLYVFGPVVTTEAHLAYAGVGIHTNDSAELSSIIEAL